MHSEVNDRQVAAGHCLRAGADDDEERRVELLELVEIVASGLVVAAHLFIGEERVFHDADSAFHRKAAGLVFY